MASYLGGLCKCPQCGNHDFTGEAKSRAEKITCSNCKHVCTVEEAAAAGKAKPKAGGSENLVDK
jgi:hypothetical protein